jgi:putative glutamine amidotransferase
LIALPSRYSENATTWRVPAFAVGQTYCESISRAGGVPCVFTPDPNAVKRLPEVLRRFDAVVLPGGPDVDPARYDDPERHEKLYDVRAEHDELDLTLARAAIDLGLPLLAICRGHQVLNVALGGTLHQHITDRETTVPHRFQYHAVQLTEGCRTASLMGTNRPIGHSVHHQAVDRLGEGLIVTGRADDGTIEAVELPDQWVVGVQWHPEDSAHADREQQALFDGLVRAAASVLRSRH